MVEVGDKVKLNTNEIVTVDDIFMVYEPWGMVTHYAVSIDGRKFEVAEWTTEKVKD